jgi:hypothetical protein
MKLQEFEKVINVYNNGVYDHYLALKHQIETNDKDYQIELVYNFQQLLNRDSIDTTKLFESLEYVSNQIKLKENIVDALHNLCLRSMMHKFSLNKEFFLVDYNMSKNTFSPANHLRIEFIEFIANELESINTSELYLFCITSIINDFISEHYNDFLEAFNDFVSEKIKNKHIYI